MAIVFGIFWQEKQTWKECLQYFSNLPGRLPCNTLDNALIHIHIDNHDENTVAWMNIKHPYSTKVNFHWKKKRYARWKQASFPPAKWTSTRSGLKSEISLQIQTSDPSNHVSWVKKHWKTALYFHDGEYQDVLFNLFSALSLCGGLEQLINPVYCVVWNCETWWACLWQPSKFSMDKLSAIYIILFII